MKNRNRFTGALLGAAMLGGLSAAVVHPAFAQTGTDTPAAPATPATPATPASPDTTAAPAAPATPDATAAPAAPATPDASTAPATPDTSTTPAAPSAPDASSTPATPDASTTPATPATPDATAAPAAPTTPTTPDATMPATTAAPSAPPDAGGASGTPATSTTSLTPPGLMPSSAPMTFTIPLTQLISPIPGQYTPAPTLSTGPVNQQLNYRALTYRNLDDIELQNASILHYSDRTLAKILKISKLTGLSFHSVREMVDDGYTFPTICENLGLSLKDVSHVKEEEKQIADFHSAYEATGKFSFKHPSVLGPAFRDPGSQGSVLAETPDLNQPLPVPVSHGM